MGNKLREMFSDENELYLGTLTFKNTDAKKNFFEAMEQASEDGNMHLVSGLSRAQVKAKNAENLYPISDDEIEEIYIGPFIEKVEIPIDVNGKTENFSMNRKKLKNRIELSTPEESVVEVKMVLPEKEEKITFSYNLHVTQASCMTELIHEFEKLNAFMTLLFSRQKLSEVEKIKKYLQNAISNYKRWQRIEQLLSIHIEPKNINQEDDSTFILEKLYIWLEQKKPIRNNSKLNSIEDADIEISNLTVGTELIAASLDQHHITAYGCEFDIYVVNIVFNAVISKIEQSNDMVQILFNDKDTKPMYSSELGFASMKEAEEEMKIAMKHQELYRNAHRIDEYLEEWMDR